MWPNTWKVLQNGGLGTTWTISVPGVRRSTYLRRLPLSTLKIDQSFVHGMMNDAGDLAIVQGRHRAGTPRLATASLPKAWKPLTRAGCCCNWLPRPRATAAGHARGRFHPMGQELAGPDGSGGTAHIQTESI